MSDGIYINEKGQAAAVFADKPAWHKLGTVVQGLMVWQDCYEKALLNYEVEVTQLEYNGKKIPIYATRRTDTNQFFKACGKNYQVIQNRYAFDFVDAVLNSVNGAHYDSAGALDNGERIFVSAKIPYNFEIMATGDIHETYLLFYTSHDGSMSACCKLTIIRVVCNNTLQQAQRMNGTFTKIKHTKEAQDKLEKAKKLMSNAQASVQSVQQKLELLAKREMTKETYIKCLNKIFPTSDPEKSSTRRDNTLKEITELFAHNDGNAIPEIKGTAYNLLNAVTQYTDHYRPTRLTENRQVYTIEQARAETALFGTGADLKASALDIIIKETEKCKLREPKIISVPKPPTIDGILGQVIDATPLH